MFSHFQKYLPAQAERDKCLIETETGTTISALLKHLGIPEEMARVITVNDTNRKEDFILNDADMVKIFPAAMGG